MASKQPEGENWISLKSALLRTVWRLWTEQRDSEESAAGTGERRCAAARRPAQAGPPGGGDEGGTVGGVSDRAGPAAVGESGRADAAAPYGRERCSNGNLEIATPAPADARATAGTVIDQGQPHAQIVPAGHAPTARSASLRGRPACFIFR